MKNHPLGDTEIGGDVSGGLSLRYPEENTYLDLGGQLREECQLKLEEKEKGNAIILEYLKKSPQPRVSGSTDTVGFTNMETLLLLTGCTVARGARDPMEDRL